MFHYRWARDVDQISSAGRIARMRGPKASEQEHAAFAGAGARPHGGPGLVRRVQRSDRAADRGRLPGDAGPARQLISPRGPICSAAGPAYGDFGLWGQFYEMWTDPTAGALIEGGAPHVLDWVHRMLWPRAEGAFETWTRWRRP